MATRLPIARSPPPESSDSAKPHPVHYLDFTNSDSL
jgi:hypothetical protein